MENCILSLMMINKRILALIILALVFCSAIDAQNTNNLGYFQGDDLNNTLKLYTKNVINLIPDASTMQNIWAITPKKGNILLGGGINGSFTFMQRRFIKSDQDGFGGVNYPDLSQFPTGIPYLPGLSIDLRAGYNRFDIGLYGMWIDENSFTNESGVSFLGPSSHFIYRTFGIDARYVLWQEKGLTPSVLVNAGYSFTWMGFGISSGATEKATTDFRTDSFFIAAQASKTLLGFFTPYIGLKSIFSKTDYAYQWETHRPVMIQGKYYPNGAKYKSGGFEGDYYTYLQFYGGIGVYLIVDLTVGFSYNIITNHFGINMAARYLL